MTAANDNPLAYSVKGAAAAIGISHRTLWRLISAGEVPTFKIGCRTLIRADALRGFIDKRSQAA